MTNVRILRDLVAEGLRLRFGDRPEKEVLRRFHWEMKHIGDAGYVDYYLAAYWLFRHYAQSSGIGYWARGAVPSSIVCYCLGLTEIAPVKYGLHSVRFVNDELPMFQFDIECSYFDEFIKGAEEYLETNSQYIDIASVKVCLFRDLTPMYYLSQRQEIQVPDNLDDEIACYALTFPDTQLLFDTYTLRKKGFAWSPTGIALLDEILAPTYGLLVYQEQMLDILKEFFDYPTIERNKVRISIQRGETEQIQAYKKELFANLKDITTSEAETAWQCLTSNPRAFLKAHTVSRVLAKYKFNN